jgi:ribosome-binding factor A
VKKRLLGLDYTFTERYLVLGELCLRAKYKIKVIEPSDTVSRLLKILKAIYENGPLTVYDVEKKTDLPHATVYKTIKEAYGKNLLTVVSESVFRTGLKSRKYFLTPLGFNLLLDELGNLFFEEDGSLRQMALVKFDELAIQHSPLFHPSFRWWPYFRDGGAQVKRFFFLLLDSSWDEFFPSAVFALFFSEPDGSMIHSDAFPGWKFTNEELDALRSEIITIIKRNQNFGEELDLELKFWELNYQEALKDVTMIRKTLEKAVQAGVEKGEGEPERRLREPPLGGPGREPR